MPTPTTDLTGHLLIAMPGMADPRFARSVVFLCRHSDEGAFGLVINKPLPEMRLSAFLAQFDLACTPSADEGEVHFGGPVETNRGFVLHTADYSSREGTQEVTPGVNLSATLDVLADLAVGEGPRGAIVALGYAGWGPGQLEREIGQNAWLTTLARNDLLFRTPAEGKWAAAVRAMGIDPQLLSSHAGRA